MAGYDLDKAAAELGVDVTRLQVRLGAEIDGVDLRRPLSDPQRDVLRAALLKYRVIFFRDQDVTREQHMDFARNFGVLEVHPIHQGAYPEILPVKTPLAPPAEARGEDLAANMWHTDMTGRACPPSMAVLRGIKVPPLGGETVWSCAVSAYQGLDAQTKARIEDMVCEHSMLHALGKRFLGKDPQEQARIERDYPPQLHPVVRIHPETGEKMLFVNVSFCTRIVGLDPAESDALLQRLFLQFWRPEFQVRFKWSPNSLALWDERSTQHYAVQGFEGIEERHLERVAIAGDRPIGSREWRQRAAA